MGLNSCYKGALHVQEQGGGIFENCRCTCGSIGPGSGFEVVIQKGNCMLRSGREALVKREKAHEQCKVVLEL